MASREVIEGLKHQYLDYRSVSESCQGVKPRFTYFKCGVTNQDIVRIVREANCLLRSVKAQQATAFEPGLYFALKKSLKGVWSKIQRRQTRPG